jgi:hypothetical protein
LPGRLGLTMSAGRRCKQLPSISREAVRGWAPRTTGVSFMLEAAVSRSTVTDAKREPRSSSESEAALLCVIVKRVYARTAAEVLRAHLLGLSMTDSSKAGIGARLCS